jgi:hypothetical protein
MPGVETIEPGAPPQQYTERGIEQLHGVMAERWRIEPSTPSRSTGRWGRSACSWSQ